jgi:hypothetical protein
VLHSLRIGRRVPRLGVIAAAIAAAAIAAGVTYAVFSLTAAGGASSFSAADVTLAQSAVHTCVVTGLAPGDASTGWTQPGPKDQCSFTVTYAGSAPAFLGLDVSFAGTQAGSDPNGVLPGAAGLYDSSATGLQVLIRDAQSTPVTYMNGTVLGGAATSGADAGASNLLVSTTPATTGTTVTFTVDYLLPASTTNAYEHAASSVTLTVHAAQAGNNGSAASCTAGRVCPGIGSWQ